MLEVIKNYLLFGVVENIIIFMFLRHIYKLNVRYLEVFYLSPLFIFASIFNIPFGRQLFGVFIIILYIVIKNKTKIINSIKYTIVSFMYLLCVEMLICAPMDMILSIDLTKTKDIDKFFWLIPIRAIEVSLIFIYKKYKK